MVQNPPVDYVQTKVPVDGAKIQSYKQCVNI